MIFFTARGLMHDGNYITPGMAMKKYAAFFDLDNTILDTSSGRLFIDYSYRKGRISRSVLFYGMFIVFAHRLGLIDTESVIRKWALKYRGLPERDIKAFSDAWFEESVIPHFREGAVREVDEHRRNGGVTILLSAATPYVCRPAGDYLKMDEVLCTVLEVDSGVLTGRLTGRYNYGAEKLRQAEEYCRANGYRMEEAYYYADSFADIPVLERVGHPVCVTPDRRLTKRAKDEDWRIALW